MSDGHNISRPIKLKISLLVASVLCLVTFFAVASSFLFFWDDFQKLEQQEADRNAHRVRAGFFGKVENLHQFALDWSSWDDTYNFVRYNSAVQSYDYVNKNLTKSTFWNANLDSVIYLNKNGETVWARDFNSETGQLRSSNPRILEFAKSHRPFSKSGKYGIYVSDTQVSLISIRPVLTSDHEGPRQGYLTLMQTVDEDFINAFKKETKTNFSLKIVPKVIRQLGTPAITDGWGQHIEDDQRISFFNVASINGEYNVEFDVYTERSITDKALSALTWNAAVIIGSVIAVFLVMIVSLDYIVVNPLRRMARTILTMGKEGADKNILNEHRKDEIGLISHEVNKMQDRILDLALNDHLTNLPNRRLFEDRMESALERARRENSQVALLFMDLNGFKQVNDTLGHQVGDELLVRVARRLKTVTRASDSLARLGGDEFGLIMELHDGDSLNSIKILCQKIVTTLERAFLIEGQEINISTSIGISIFPDNARDSTTIIRFADIAMYACKSDKSQLWCFYAPEMEKDLIAKG